jgi:uncharacterized protein
MVMLAKAIPQIGLPERNFATLGEAELAKLRAILRPLPWIDGLIAASVIAPADLEPDDWLDHTWIEEELGKLTIAEADGVASMVTDQHEFVFAMLFESPELYQPFLGKGDRLEAAAQWAAGFRFGIRLRPEPWAPLIDDDGARMLLATIFCLEREEDQPQGFRAESPFADVSPERREEMRRTSLTALPEVICALHQVSLALDADELDDQVVERPFVRVAPKVGRNEPCPCGSGKKYKKCCLNEAA